MSIVSVNTYYMYLKEMVLVKFFRNQFNKYCIYIRYVLISTN